MHQKQAPENLYYNGTATEPRVTLKHYKQKQKTQGKMRVTSETFPRGCDVVKKALD